MSNFITKSLEWVPLPGLTREQVVDDIVEGAVASSDKGDHIWVATINNRGTTLFCYGLQLGLYEHQGRQGTVWYAKRIPEDAGPDVFDCPLDILDMCRILNPAWRQEHAEKSKKG